MKKKFIILLVSIAVLGAGLVAASFLIVPHSLRLYVASTATCQNLEEALLDHGDLQFEGVKFWEVPLALTYRFKYWHFGGPTKVSDWATGGESNVFSIFLSAAESVGGECDEEILQLIERYVDGSRSLDYCDVIVYTALHQAIYLQKVEFIKILLDGGADTSLIVHSEGRPTDGMNAVELAAWFSEQKYSGPNSAEIAAMLANAD